MVLKLVDLPKTRQLRSPPLADLQIATFTFWTQDLLIVAEREDEILPATFRTKRFFRWRVRRDHQPRLSAIATVSPTLVALDGPSSGAARGNSRTLTMLVA
jgi:hypothetical protein